MGPTYLNYFNIIYFPIQIPAIILAMTLHEYVKAVLAVRFGDTTPKKEGRLTLNPFKHVEIIGFLLMLFIGYGWSQPTPVNPMMFDDQKRRKQTLITYITPTLFNLMAGTLFVFISLTFRSGLNVSSPNAEALSYVLYFLERVAVYNVALAVFNIIPVYPMDGWKVLSMYLSPNARVQMSNYEKIIQIVLIFLLVSGILGNILGPICRVIVPFA